MTEPDQATDRSQRGQSTVELALLLPLLFAIALAVVQVGVVVYSQMAVTHTAREVARALAVDPQADVEDLVTRSAILDPDGLVTTVDFEVSAVQGRQLVSVQVSYQVRGITGLFEGSLGDIEVRASVTMLVEL